MAGVAVLRNAQPACLFVRSDTFSTGISNNDEVVVLDGLPKGGRAAMQCRDDRNSVRVIVEVDQHVLGEAGAEQQQQECAVGDAKAVGDAPSLARPPGCIVVHFL